MVIRLTFRREFNRIDAIKMVRTISYGGLRDSKVAIDSLTAIEPGKPDTEHRSYINVGQSVALDVDADILARWLVNNRPADHNVSIDVLDIPTVFNVRRLGVV